MPQIEPQPKKVRDSNLELFRIVTMLIIVAHHYVVNSGYLELIKEFGATSSNSLFLLLFGWGGKTGINCFVLITGYFMVKSQITLNKFLKLFLEIEFYSIIIAIIFFITKYNNYSIQFLIKDILPISSITNSFTSCYLLFFLFIPYLNILLNKTSERQHRYLIALCVLMFTILPLIHIKISFNYVQWFIILYIIAAYLRLHPIKKFQSNKFCGLALLISFVCSWATVIWGAWRYDISGKVAWYKYVADSNAIFALTTAIFAFLFFKNLKIKHSKIINTISASAFGVLLIHAASDTMRQWLWTDTLQNTLFFNSDYLAIHAIASVLGIYIICTLIDFMRIHLLEVPFFHWFDSKKNKMYVKGRR